MMRDSRSMMRPLVIVLFGLAALSAAGASAARERETSSRPALTPEQRAQATLDRYVAATGGREALEAQHSTHLRGRVTAFGLSGTTETWSERPDRSASLTKIGPFTLRQGFDGTTGWRTDPSGKLTLLEGRDLERAKSSAWFENDEFLASGHGGGTVTWIGTEKDSGGRYDVLEIAAPGSTIPHRLWFDAETGLLARELLKEDQQSVVSTLSDWRAVGGRRVAFQTHTAVVGMPANAITLAVDSIEVNLPSDPARFAPPAAAAGAVRWLKHDGVARLPFQYRGRHVWLRASINGAPPADFLFDTGASITVIDSAYAAKMGIQTEGRMEAMGASSSGGASFAKVQTLRVAGDDSDGVELTDQKVGVLSVNATLAPFFWRDCAGVLGYSFISQFVDEIDFDRRLLTLHDPKGFEYQGHGTRIPMTLAGTVPVVKMTLDRDIEGEYRLDVGSNSTVDLHGPFVQKHRLDRGRGRMIEAHGAGFGGEFTSHIVRFKRLDLGPYGWDQPVVSLSGATSGGLASEDYAGNVGNQILERFTCTFDYDRHAVYLEPGEKYRRPDHFSRAGMLLVRYADTVKAGQVLKDSPAARAGIRDGDVVLGIDGRPILSYDVDDLAKLFEEGEEGRKVAVEISRDGKRRVRTMRLREMI